MSTTIVCGPPGSGKSTWVREHAQPGDLIVDLDTLWQALSGQPMYAKPPALYPFVVAARDGTLAQLEKGGIVTAWVIASGATSTERAAMRERFAARVVVLETPTIECLERIRMDERRAGQLVEWMPHVLRWWRNYEPDEADEVVR